MPVLYGPGGQQPYYLKGDKAVVATNFYGYIQELQTERALLEDAFQRLYNSIASGDIRYYLVNNSVREAANEISGDIVNSAQIGDPIRYSSDNINWYYGLVNTVDVDRITVVGASIPNNTVVFELGQAELHNSYTYLFTSIYNFNDTEDLLGVLNKTLYIWQQSPAYLVKMAVYNKYNDSCDSPYINALINGCYIFSDNTYKGLQPNSTGFTYSSVDVDVSNYRIVKGDELNISVINELTAKKNARDLTVMLSFVFE